MSNDALKREIKRLRDRLVARDFRSSAPPLDEAGLPCWGGDDLSLDGYTKALGPSPDEQLSAEELATRQRLAPYAEVFRRLEETEEARM
jgi:hypothetical protein